MGRTSGRASGRTSLGWAVARFCAEGGACGSGLGRDAFACAPLSSAQRIPNISNVRKIRLRFIGDGSANDSGIIRDMPAINRPTVNRQFILVARPVGMPKESDFELVELPLPTLADGQILLRTLYLSVDPYMRSRITGI